MSPVPGPKATPEPAPQRPAPSSCHIPRSPPRPVPVPAQPPFQFPARPHFQLSTQSDLNFVFPSVFAQSSLHLLSAGPPASKDASVGPPATKDASAGPPATKDASAGPPTAKGTSAGLPATKDVGAAQPKPEGASAGLARTRGHHSKPACTPRCQCGVVYVRSQLSQSPDKPVASESLDLPADSASPDLPVAPMSPVPGPKATPEPAPQRPAPSSCHIPRSPPRPVPVPAQPPFQFPARPHFQLSTQSDLNFVFPSVFAQSSLHLLSAGPPASKDASHLLCQLASESPDKPVASESLDLPADSASLDLPVVPMSPVPGPRATPAPAPQRPALRFSFTQRSKVSSTSCSSPCSAIFTVSCQTTLPALYPV
ncbi:hypothetical protein MHYP_G00080810 [Metynnis hypsauchen]